MFLKFGLLIRRVDLSFYSRVGLLRRSAQVCPVIDSIVRRGEGGLPSLSHRLLGVT